MFVADLLENIFQFVKNDALYFTFQNTSSVIWVYSKALFFKYFCIDIMDIFKIFVYKRNRGSARTRMSERENGRENMRESEKEGEQPWKKKSKKMTAEIAG